MMSETRRTIRSTRMRPRPSGACPAPDPGRSSPENRAEAEALLAAYVRGRDLAVRNRLVLLHQPIVRFVANRFASAGGLAMEDLVQVGSIGLIAALERFDPARQDSFTTFAIPTIMGVIKHYLRDHTWDVRAPRRLRELGLRLRRVRADLETALGREPTVPEMAAAVGVSEERLIEAMDLDRLYQISSLDAPLEDERSGLSSFWDVLGELDPGLAAVENRETLRIAMGRLEERQCEILHARYVEERTQAEVARSLGVSQMHVSRLERQALLILRHYLR